ncbi:hypothetical protein AURDEDRAFT_161796, partial [Auricularia subglabra TFB-10046 SS5]
MTLAEAALVAAMHTLARHLRSDWASTLALLGTSQAVLHALDPLLYTDLALETARSVERFYEIVGARRESGRLPVVNSLSIMAPNGGNVSAMVSVIVCSVVGLVRLRVLCDYAPAAFFLNSPSDVHLVGTGSRRGARVPTFPGNRAIRNVVLDNFPACNIRATTLLLNAPRLDELTLIVRTKITPLNRNMYKNLRAFLCACGVGEAGGVKWARLVVDCAGTAAPTALRRMEELLPTTVLPLELVTKVLKYTAYTHSGRRPTVIVGMLCLGKAHRSQLEHALYDTVLLYSCTRLATLLRL